MRQTLRLPVLALCACLALPLAADDAPPAELTVDEIVARNIASRGGREAVEALDTVKITGRMTQPGMELPVTLYFARPDKARLEVEAQGMTLVQAYDGTVGWYLDPFQGDPTPREMPAAQLEQFRGNVDFEGQLYDYAAKGHTIALRGLGEVDGTPAYVLEITKANGDVITDYLDAETFLELRQRVDTEVEGRPVAMEVDFDDYRPIGDPPLLAVHSIEQRRVGSPESSTIVFDTVETNLELADDLFAMPKPVATAPGGTE